MSTKIKNEFDRVYIIKYLKELTINELAASFQTTQKTIKEVVKEIKDKGLYKYYKDMPEAEWENLDGRSKTRQQELIAEGYREWQKQLFKKLVEELKEEYPVFEKHYYPNCTSEIEITGEDEEWKTIEGFNYSISNYGMIKNNATGKIKALRNGIWGYQVNLWNNSKGKMFTISRTVANYFIREVKENERVRHIDGEKRNNYYKNLEIVKK